jgi:hypothetical protein
MDMTREISNRYLKNIIALVYDDRYGNSYKELFEYLYSKEFTWTIAMDRNRALDGIALRDTYGYPGDPLDEPCSVLEMLIALASRIENQLMWNYEEGDRTSQWFWTMLTNLGLNALDDEHFDISIAEQIVDRFLNREYDYNGEGGGLFVLNKPPADMRAVEIWFQVNWYISEQDGYL